MTCMSDAEQDAAMNAACQQQWGGSGSGPAAADGVRAASYVEALEGQIQDRPSHNDDAADHALIFMLPEREACRAARGRIFDNPTGPDGVARHSRTCVRNQDAIPSRCEDPLWAPDCSGGARAAMCIVGPTTTAPPTMSPTDPPGCQDDPDFEAWDHRACAHADVAPGSSLCASGCADLGDKSERLETWMRRHADHPDRVWRGCQSESVDSERRIWVCEACPAACGFCSADGTVGVFVGFATWHQQLIAGSGSEQSEGELDEAMRVACQARFGTATRAASCIEMLDDRIENMPATNPTDDHLTFALPEPVACWGIRDTNPSSPSGLARNCVLAGGGMPTTCSAEPAWRTNCQAGQTRSTMCVLDGWAFLPTRSPTTSPTQPQICDGHSVCPAEQHCGSNGRCKLHAACRQDNDALPGGPVCVVVCPLAATHNGGSCTLHDHCPVGGFCNSAAHCTECGDSSTSDDCCHDRPGTTRAGLGDCRDICPCSNDNDCASTTRHHDGQRRSSATHRSPSPAPQPRAAWAQRLPPGIAGQQFPAHHHGTCHRRTHCRRRRAHCRRARQLLHARHDWGLDCRVVFRNDDSGDRCNGIRARHRHPASSRGTDRGGVGHCRAGHQRHRPCQWHVFRHGL